MMMTYAVTSNWMILSLHHLIAYSYCEGHVLLLYCHLEGLYGTISEEAVNCVVYIAMILVHLNHRVHEL